MHICIFKCICNFISYFDDITVSNNIVINNSHIIFANVYENKYRIVEKKTQ